MNSVLAPIPEPQAILRAWLPFKQAIVQSAITVGSNTAAAAAGMIRFNPATTNFEGYTGTAWVSLTPRYAP